LLSFTDADLTDTYVPNNNDPSTSVQALEGRVPNYLLLVSLLEHLCSLYESDPEKSKKIFNGKIIRILEGYYFFINKCMYSIPYSYDHLVFCHFYSVGNPFAVATL